MKAYQPPVRKADPRKGEAALDELIKRYIKVPAWEAKGVLQSIAELVAIDNSQLSLDVVCFLRQVGSEKALCWEPNEELRKVARQLLYRRLMLQAVRARSFLMTTVVHELVAFLSTSDENVPTEDSDRGIVLKFLERCWAYREDTNGPRWSHLIDASINMGYFDYLLATNHGDVYQLHFYLRSKLPEEQRALVEEKPCVITPVGDWGNAITDTSLLLAGMILNDVSLSNTFESHVAQLLCMRAKWLLAVDKF